MNGRRKQEMFKPLFTWRSAISTPDSGLTPTEHHVLLTLSLHMNELGASCFPSIDTLVEETCGRSASTIRDALGHADELGWLNRSVRVGRGRSNLYEALNPAWYETHRAAVYLPATLDARRASALEAASEAEGGSHAPLDEGPTRDETHRSPVGLGTAAGDAKPAGDRQETHRRAVVNPPESGPEVHRRATGRATAAEPKNKDLEDSAAAEPERPTSLQVVRDVVEQLHRSDAGTVKAIEPLAAQLPAQAFLKIAGRVEQRRATGSVSNDAGLLITLLRIAIAERSALFHALHLEQLAASGTAPASRQSWLDVVAREQPEAYVRAMARNLTDHELAEKLDDFDRQLRELARAVRDGEEPSAPLPESTAAARLRWIDETSPSLPLDDVRQVIDTWDDADHLERQLYSERAEAARTAHSNAAAEAA